MQQLFYCREKALPKKDILKNSAVKYNVVTDKYIPFVPEEHEVRDGIHYTITSAFSGCKIFLEGAKRLSKKRLAELTNNLKLNDYKNIIEEIASNNNLIITED